MRKRSLSQKNEEKKRVGQAVFGFHSKGLALLFFIIIIFFIIFIRKQNNFLTRKQTLFSHFNKIMDLVIMSKQLKNSRAGCFQLPWKASQPWNSASGGTVTSAPSHLRRWFFRIAKTQTLTPNCSCFNCPIFCVSCFLYMLLCPVLTLILSDSE